MARGARNARQGFSRSMRNQSPTAIPIEGHIPAKEQNGQMAIRWVFFDIGDVLFDENVPHLYYFHSILLALRRNGVYAPWDDYHARIQTCVREKPETAILDAARYYVSDAA